MAMEIERKFLVKDGFQPPGHGVPMVQGYLSATDGVTVRVRRAADRYFLTIKGPTRGISRAEYEYPLPESDGADLLALCRSGLVAKTRYAVPVGNHTFEVDVFAGDNAGLVVAEVELDAEDDDFLRPAWLGEEVSSDRRYTNSALARAPFRTWT